MKAGATTADLRRRLAVRLGHPCASPLLLTAAVGVLLPLVIPGLRTPQLLLAAVLLAGAVTAAFICLLRRRPPRRSSLLLRLAAGLAVAVCSVYGWFWVAFLTACRDGCLMRGRELAVVVDGEGVRYYVYQHYGIPDGVEGAEIMERRWVVRRSLWRHRSPAIVPDLFDGRVLRGGAHELRLDTSRGVLDASIDGKSARVVTMLPTWLP